MGGSNDITTCVALIEMKGSAAGGVKGDLVVALWFNELGPVASSFSLIHELRDECLDGSQWTGVKDAGYK